MSDDLIRRSDVLETYADLYDIFDDNKAIQEEFHKVFDKLNGIPPAEPNLILPERMERGECYEVGETIVVLNHDDYYDLLCRAMENKPKQGEWIGVTNGRGGHECSNCHAYAPSYMSGDEHLSDYCPSCGARMFPTQMSER